VAADARRAGALFDPAAFTAFHFLERRLDARGLVTLRYALDDEHVFEERFELALPGPLSAAQIDAAAGPLALLHWVAGVSYYKTAAPPLLECDGEAPGSAARAWLEALYSEGLGEFAYRNGLPALPRPRFPQALRHSPPAALEERPQPRRVLIPVGGGKDSAVAIEIMRRSDCELALFSIGDAAPIARTVAVAGLPHVMVRRRIDPLLGTLNETGALNGHVPVTAIVTAVALLSAALLGFDTVAMANERSASTGSLRWDGVEVNHQFSKGLRAERLLDAVLAEVAPSLRTFSLLRGASELAIARAFARMPAYHGAFTSCNAIFRLDPELRSASWCCECPKCAFVFLVLAPFMEPVRLHAIFGRDLLAEEDQFDGFALLCATGGHKPFECVGEEQESIAAIRLLAHDARWREHAVVRRLLAEVLPRQPEGSGDPATVLALSDEHDVPESLIGDVRALLGA